MGNSKKIEKPRKSKYLLRQTNKRKIEKNNTSNIVICRRTRRTCKYFVDKRCSYKRELSRDMSPFVCLNDDVLLKVISYLDMNDLVNLSATCPRMQKLLGFWIFNKCEVNLHFIREQLKSIGPQIRILSSNFEDINRNSMDNCINVTSLRISTKCSDIFDTRKSLCYSKSSLEHVRECNEWIKQLNLESLWLINGVHDSVKHTNALIDEVRNVKELRIDANANNLKRMLERNSNVERLSITVPHRFGFSIFKKLQNLRCLHIIIDFRDLDKLIQFGNFVEVSELSVRFYDIRDGYPVDPARLNALLEILARDTKLDKLRLILPRQLSPNENTFRMLTLLNLNVLGLYWIDYHNHNWNHEMHYLSKFIREATSSIRHLTLSCCSLEQLKLLVKTWKNLEVICVRHCENLEHTFLKEILSLCNDRQLLTLYTGFPLVQIKVWSINSIENCLLHTEITD